VNVILAYFHNLERQGEMLYVMVISFMIKAARFEQNRLPLSCILLVIQNKLLPLKIVKFCIFFAVRKTFILISHKHFHNSHNNVLIVRSYYKSYLYCYSFIRSNTKIPVRSIFRKKCTGILSVYKLYNLFILDSRVIVDCGVMTSGRSP